MCLLDDGGCGAHPRWHARRSDADGGLSARTVAPSSTRVATGHLDNKVRFWDMRTKECINELSDIHSGQITSLNLAPSRSAHPVKPGPPPR